MKMYITPFGTYAETDIDPSVLSTGLADSSIIERDATYDETLAECYRLRTANYPPLTQLGDAIYHQNNGDSSQMQAYLSAVEAVKAKYPKPSPPGG